MNIVYGYASNYVDEHFSSRISELDLDSFAKLGSQEAITSANNTVNCHYHSDNGAVIGLAHNEDFGLILYGVVHGPLPGLSSKGMLDSSTETADFLLSRFIHMGSDFLLGIIGAYSVIVIDKKNNKIYLASDPLGQRSLFIYENESQIVFSSNLRTLSTLLGDAAEIDRSYEDFLLLYGFYPENSTLIKNVKRLPSGVVFKWERGKTNHKSFQLINPWEGKNSNIDLEQATENEVIDILYESFLTALQEQCTNEQKVAVLLGGFDSALIASGLKAIGKEVETFSFYYENNNYNQPHTDTLASFLDINHNWIDINEKVFRDGLYKFTRNFNSPTNWPNYVIQTEYVCQKIREKGYKYCYTGDGCDSIFMGYPGTYLRARVLDSLPSLPLGLTKIILSIISWPYLDRKLGHPYRVILNLIRSMGRDMPSRGYLSFRVMDEISIKELRKGKSVSIDDVESYREKIASPYRGMSSLRLAYLGKSAVSPNNNKMVGSSDSSGLSILSPYLHPGLKNLALILPDSMCRPNEKTKSKITGKYILMKMAETKGLLPKEIIYQKKMAGVDAPIDDWYAKGLKKDILKICKGLPFDYDESYINAISKKKTSEELFKKYVLTDKVISHAVSLIVTYASFASLVNPKDENNI